MCSSRLRDKYAPSSKQFLSFNQVYSAYRKDRPKDAIKLSEFCEVVEKTFPEVDHNSVGLALRSTVGTPSSRCADAPQADATDAAALPTEAPLRAESETSRGTRDKAGTRAVGTARQSARTSIFAAFARPRRSTTPSGSTGTPGSRQRLPWDTQDDAPGRRTTTPSNGATAVAVVDRAPSTELMDRVAGPERQSSATVSNPSVNGISTTHARVQHQNRQVLNAHEDGDGTFARFVGAYKTIKPGGAFAEAQKEQPKVRRHFNVLSWEL